MINVGRMWLGGLSCDVTEYTWPGAAHFHVVLLNLGRSFLFYNCVNRELLLLSHSMVMYTHYRSQFKPKLCASFSAVQLRLDGLVARLVGSCIQESAYTGQSYSYNSGEVL